MVDTNETHANEPKRDDHQGHDTAQLKFLDELLGEDRLENKTLSSTLQSVPQVKVPSGFVPSVMFRVFEHHARTQIKFLQVALITLLLTGASAAFFAWDVIDYMQANNLNSFKRAVSTKINLTMESVNGMFNQFTDILSASWQIVTGSSLGVVVIILALAAMFGALILIRRWVIQALKG